jgi:outer membrane lipoprotein-sorting protein
MEQKMRIGKRTLAVAFMLVGATGQAWTAQPDGSWGIDSLMQELAAREHSQARFVERKYLRVLKSPLELSGTLSYSRPGFLEKRTLKPKPETLTVDGDRLTLENPARNERRVLSLQDYPVLWGFVESMRATLGGDINALERFYRVELDGTADNWRLFLDPRERKMKEVISMVRIDGHHARIERIEVQEARGDRSVMRIHEAIP